MPTITMTIRCSCGKEFAIYEGDVVGIPFGRLPEQVAQATAHKCKPRSKKP